MCTEDGWNPAAGTVGCKAIDRNRVTAAGNVVMVSIGWALAGGLDEEGGRREGECLNQTGAIYRDEISTTNTGSDYLV
jgi:hypothetical protein